jgi:RecA-family ATPase
MSKAPDINDTLRYEGPDAVRERLDRAYRKANNGAGNDEKPLPYVDLALPITPREWLVPDRIPMRNVTSLSGQGAIGKSLLLMQLGAAIVLGKDWIGTQPRQGPVLYMSCEEDDDEVRRRMEDVARYYGSTRTEMIERGLRVLSFAGRNAVLAQPDTGIMQPTPLFHLLRRDAIALQPKLIVLDTVADIFAGKEIDRAQTRQFITGLRGLAIEANSALVIAAHPSLEGIRSDTGLSGSTGWHNSVRARMYFKAAEDNDDTTLRVLEVKKSNYGPVGESIVLRWRDGVYVVAGVADQPTDTEQVLERLREEEKADQLFLTLLRRFSKQGRNVTDKKGTSYAPAIFADEPEAKREKIKNKALADAMARLFAAEKLEVVPHGPRSKERTKIVEVTGKPSYSAGTSTKPSTNVSPTSTNIPPLSPSYSPSNGGRGKGLGGSPPLPPSARKRKTPLADVLAAWMFAIGPNRPVTVAEVITAANGKSYDIGPDYGQKLRSALTAKAVAQIENTPQFIDAARLEQWLRDNSDVEVDHLMLRSDGADEKGAPRWTLTLRVEPDQGSPSL